MSWGNQPKRPVSLFILALVALLPTRVFGQSAGAETLTLDEAIKRALAVAPSVALAAAGSSLSDAQARELRAPLFPSVSTSVEYEQFPGYNEVITNGGLSSAQLALSYTAFDFGRRLARADAARSAAEGVALGAQAVRTQTVLDATLAYFGLVRADGAERELRASLERMERYVIIINALTKSGRAISNDVLKIQAARDSAEREVARAERARQDASVVLCLLMGEPARTDLKVAQGQPLPAQVGGDLSKSPLLQAAKRAVTSARYELSAAERERYPTFQVALTTGFLGIHPRQTVEHNGGASYDGLISMPIFTGGAITARIDQAKARLQSALAQVRQVELELKRRLAQASLRYGEARRQLDILARSQPTADDAFALDWSRFLGGGHVTMLEVLDAYQLAESLKLEKLGETFAVRQAAAEAAFVLGIMP